MKFRVTSSDWSLGNQHAGWMAGFEMGKLKLINKYIYIGLQNGCRMRVENIQVAIIISLS